MRPADYLYNLLPRFNRSQDLAEGGPLRALFALLQAQYDLIEDDIGALYSNWFAESCEDWALPYIADLIGGVGIELRSDPGINGRRLVANTIAYRRRSGLAAMLEQIVEDVTGWPACVREWHDITAMTETVERVSGRAGFVDINHAPNRTLWPDNPFNNAPRNVDIRMTGIAPGRVAICIWRRPLFLLQEATALPGAHGEYFLHPLGIDSPLFQAAPVQRSNIMQRRDVTRFPARFNGAADHAAFALRLIPNTGGPGDTVPSDQILLADLSSWQRPDTLQSHYRAVLDARRGRVLLPQQRDHSMRVEADYIYAAPAAIGGGAYHRGPMVETAELPVVAIVAAREGTMAEVVPDLSEALSLWQQSGRDSVIEFADSMALSPPAAQGEWIINLAGERPRTLVLRAENGRRPCLAGDLRIRADRPGHRLVLDGMMIGGSIHLDGPLELVVHHATVMAGEHRLALSGADSTRHGQRLQIRSSIVGPLRLSGKMDVLRVEDSIVDGCGLLAVAAGPRPHAVDVRNHGHGPSASFLRSTVWGGVIVSGLEARDSLFSHPVLAETAAGEVWHCCLPAASRTPVQSHCVTLDPVDAAGTAGPFLTTRYGAPDYCRLAPWVPAAVGHGASDGGEIGVFNHLADHHRRSRLRAALDEYFPIGLHSVVIEVP